MTWTYHRPPNVAECNQSDRTTHAPEAAKHFYQPGWRTSELSAKERTVTLSLRISEVAYKALQEDAKKQNASLNTIANQILLAYAEHDRYLKKYGLLKVVSPLYVQLLNAASDEALTEAGKSLGPGILPGMVMSMTGELTVAGILDWLKRMGTYSGLTDYTEISHGGRISVTMTHDNGPKGSLLLASFLDSLFKTAGKQIKITQLRDSVTFEV